MAADLAHRANENYRGAFELLSEELRDGDVRRFETVTATATGLPVASFNRVFALEVPSPDDLAAGVEWMIDRDDPFWITATERSNDVVREVAAAYDCGFVESQPGMVMHLDADIPLRDSPADIVEVAERDGLRDLIDVFAAVFDLPIDIARQGYPDSLLGHDQFAMFVGYVDSEPVACGTLISSADIAGVYSIAVIDEYRRQGIGTDVTWAVLEAGHDAGYDLAVLQSSEKSYPVYEAVGFETVVTYRHFGRA